ncbi:uncharacterized protein PRCAT00004915001 [Priceomyces carsonii]|uniref:uncharacterized protein n=1 Tax=Priceomyces carsonii TaxID=28549 RepID=UPI002EDB96F1|nr:unnamed protein product [Priceomyces carsonii]
MLSLLLFYVIAIAQCSVYVGFPFDEQLPNVARVNKLYSFTMANTTFKSTTGALSYSASSLPSWLSFDSESRTFTGNPSSLDVNNYTITLSGSDSDDTLSRNYTILVSDDPGLHLSSDDAIFTKLAKYGRTNGYDGLVVTPGEHFSIKFDSSVFKLYPDSERSIIAYYGRSEDRSSLPNWINFDSDSFTFSGTVPDVTSSIAPSFEYGFSFIASDYYGYAGAEGIFKLVVGAHELSTSVNETMKVNGTLGSEIEIDVPILSDVFLDGNEISKENITSVYADELPSYATFDDDDYTISGNFPNTSKSDNFSIVVEDKFGNTVELPYLLNAIGSVFTVKKLPNVNATRGEYFEHELLESYFTAFDDTNVSVSFDSDWLNYTEHNLTLSGFVPKSFKKSTIKVKAKGDNLGYETKSFNIIGISEKSKSSSSSAHSSTSISSESGSTSLTSSSSSLANDDKNSGLSRNKKLAIGLGVGIPCFLIAIAALILIFCCCFKRNDDKTDDEEKSSGDVLAPGFLPPMGMADSSNRSSDSDDDARQISAMNVLKLDAKHSSSTSSSVTHVESDSQDSRYFDASEKPMKSWRANDKSDEKEFRKSDASLSTVNTEQLFSVRLVDDQSFRNSNQSSVSGMPMSANNYGTLTRDSSGNIQRLDSDGNIVESSYSSLDPQKVTRSHSSNLGILEEETSKEHTDSTIRPEDSTIYHSTQDGKVPDSNSSNMNLLSNFNESRNPSTYEPDMSNYSNDSDSSLFDEFQATTNEEGEVKWKQARNGNKFVSSSSEQLITKSNSRMTGNSLRNSNLSAISFESMSSELLVNKDVRTSSPSFGKKAKLIDFTRKGSLRESAYEPEIRLEGETAQIHYDDSD